MAIFKSILGTVSGKSGNLIFSRNKGGQYLKEYKKPTNPKTALQVAVRQIRSITSKAWAALTQEVKNAWNSFAEDNPVLNRLGDPIYLSGFGWFQKAAYYYRLCVGSLTSIRVPDLTAIPELVIETLTCDLLTGIIVTTAEAVPATCYMIIRAQVFNSQGVTNPGRMKQVAVVDPSEPAATDIKTPLQALFGTLIVGQVVFVEAFLVQANSGGAGPVATTGKVVITDTTP